MTDFFNGGAGDAFADSAAIATEIGTPANSDTGAPATGLTKLWVMLRHLRVLRQHSLTVVLEMPLPTAQRLPQRLAHRRTQVRALLLLV